MKCNEIEQQLAEYLGGELEASVVEAIDAHLAGCGECRREVGSLHETLDALHRLDSRPAAAMGRGRRRQPAFQPLAYAATLLIGLGVGWWIKSMDVASPPSLVLPVSGGRDYAPPGVPGAWTGAEWAKYTNRSASTPFARNTVKLVRALSTWPL